MISGSQRSQIMILCAWYLLSSEVVLSERQTVHKRNWNRVPRISTHQGVDPSPAPRAVNVHGHVCNKPRQRVQSSRWTPSKLCFAPIYTIFFFFFFLSFFLVGAHHVACGILVPWPGMETGSSAVKAQSPNHWTSREFPIQFSILENPIYDSQNIKSPDVAILLCKQSCEIITNQKVERKQI